ncbi:MAG TPA: methylated-DNA--[protein]-cysteine S-methyltransferase [Ktedonobacterales bacterium]|nr:methylated-DNA--[protein]-cysteine S-methyltransferase [Ktedonobacterales bacterium]
MVMRSNETGALAHGAVMTWAGNVVVTAGPVGVRTAEIPRWSETRSETRPETSPDFGAITVYEGGDADALGYLRQALGELDEYFRGARREFTVALDPQGTAFYRAAWDAVARVPFGETRAYAEIARAIGSPRAIRAVGAANGANPVAPFVPCHRIVGSDGRLTGYGPGLPLKARLLAMEGAIPADADAYDAWVDDLRARNEGYMPALAIRGTPLFCAPGCARSRARWAFPPRIFASAAAAQEAGYLPCPQCGG